MSRPGTTGAEGAQPWPGPHHRPAAEVQGPGKTRLHALDAIRGSAMFLVVTFHAGLAYTHIDIPRLVWCVRDPAPHLGFDVFCLWAMGVSNPLFFTMAGFFAANLYETRGPTAFLKNRAQRIVGPLLAGLWIILPLEMYAWAFGWLVTGRCNSREFQRMSFHEPEVLWDRYGPGHLWFLYYLIPMLLGYWLIQRARAERPDSGPRWTRWAHGFDRLLLGPWKPLVLMVPTALLVWLSRRHAPVDVVLDRHNTFGLDAIRLLHHGLFFAVGGWLYRVRHELGRFAAQGLPYLALSLVVFAGRAGLLWSDWARPLTGLPLAASAVLGALFGWLTVFGIIGVFQRSCDQTRPLIRYLADSSYWVYLWHLPILGLVQADLYRVALPAVLKFAIVLVVTLALGLSSYHVFVRYTVLGRWLHGPRHRPGTSGPRAPHQTATGGPAFQKV